MKLTWEDLHHAHATFYAKDSDSGATDYDRALALVNPGFAEDDRQLIVKGQDFLLQTWHCYYYHFRPQQTIERPAVLRALLDRHWDTILALRPRDIRTFIAADNPAIQRLFSAYSMKLGPVGASKALSLAAPHLLPMWDNNIASGCNTYPDESNYLPWMRRFKRQAQALGDAPGWAQGLSVPKLIDEWNYCRFTRGWLKEKVTA